MEFSYAAEIATLSFNESCFTLEAILLGENDNYFALSYDSEDSNYDIWKVTKDGVTICGEAISGRYAANKKLVEVAFTI